MDTDTDLYAGFNANAEETGMQTRRGEKKNPTAVLTEWDILLLFERACENRRCVGEISSAE